MASTRFILASLLIILVSLQVADSQPRKAGCLPKAGTCPDRKSKLCGVYATCRSLRSAFPDLQSCDDCAAFDLKKMPASSCNFVNGRCSPNKIAGKSCTAKTLNQPCDKKVPGFTCLKVEMAVTKKNPQGYRCCRTTCPAGLCGKGSKTMSWTNQCNMTIDCPTNCAPRAANAVSVTYL